MEVSSGGVWCVCLSNRPTNVKIGLANLTQPPAKWLLPFGRSGLLRAACCPLAQTTGDSARHVWCDNHSFFKTGLVTTPSQFGVRVVDNWERTRGLGLRDLGPRLPTSTVEEAGAVAQIK